MDLPAEIVAGIEDASKTGRCGTHLRPTNMLCQRRYGERLSHGGGRYEAVRSKLSNGEIDDINALITAQSQHSRQFAQDVIENCEDS